MEVVSINTLIINNTNIYTSSVTHTYSTYVSCVCVFMSLSVCGVCVCVCVCVCVYQYKSFKVKGR